MVITTQEKIKKVEDLVAHYKLLNDYWDKLSEVLGADIETGLADLNWRIFDKLTDYVSSEIGDEDGWISFFLYENKLGAADLTVKVDGKSRKLGNVKQLVKLIEELDAKD